MLADNVNNELSNNPKAALAIPAGRDKNIPTIPPLLLNMLEKKEGSD